LRLALEDVRVVEYGNLISVPYCGKMLADLGAEVIKIEEPGTGDIARRRGPFLANTPGSERSALFLYLNSNKFGVTLDVRKASGKEIFERLIKSADILLEDGPPESVVEKGIGYNDLSRINPSLVMTSITDFGQTGPYHAFKGSDLIAWHSGGEGYINPRFAGTETQEPLRTLHMADFNAGIVGALSTMAALRVQRLNGFGQHVDVSKQEACIVMMGYNACYYPFEHRSITRASRAEFAPNHFIKCKDGWVYIQCTEDRHWRRLVELLGNNEWAEEDLFKTHLLRAKHWESLEPLISFWAIEYTKAELSELGKEKGIPLVPVNTVSDVVQSQHLKEREYFTRIPSPYGEVTCPGAPYRLSRTPWSIKRPAPLLGQHNWDVFCGRLGFSEDDLVHFYESGVI